MYNGRPYLTDFGIAKVKDNVSGLTSERISSTHGYEAPEYEDLEAHRIYGRYPTAKTDIYAFGCVLIEVWSLSCLKCQTTEACV